MVRAWTALTMTAVLIVVGATLATGWPPEVAVGISIAVALCAYLFLRAVMPSGAR